MRRRVGLGLLAALALLLAPAASAAVAPLDAGAGHHTARIAPVDRHGTLAHTIAPNRVRARRGAPHRTATAAVLLASSVGLAATSPLTIVPGFLDSGSADLPSTSRPRAPPPVV